MIQFNYFDYSLHGHKQGQKPLYFIMFMDYDKHAEGQQKLTQACLI